MSNQAEIRSGDAWAFLVAPPDRQFDYIYIAPPNTKGILGFTHTWVGSGKNGRNSPAVGFGSRIEEAWGSIPVPNFHSRKGNYPGKGGKEGSQVLKNFGPEFLGSQRKNFGETTFGSIFSLTKRDFGFLFGISGSINLKGHSGWGQKKFIPSLIREGGTGLGKPPGLFFSKGIFKRIGFQRV